LNIAPFLEGMSSPQMLTAKSQFAYFESLEKTIKVALALYLLAFCCGILIDVIGFGTFLEQVHKIELPIGLLVIANLVGLFYGLLYGINKVHWLGELHIWLDQKFFGFLKKTNDIIFHGLLVALDPSERDSAVNIAPGEKGALAKSIFSQLANDNELFEALLESGIFRTWIWYWIAIYGTLIFTLLAVGSFAAAVMGQGGSAKSFFAITWILALIHFAVSLSMGFHLLRMTRSTLDSIVSSHKDEIAGLLRANINTFQASL
jgi:hypothetical protein